MVNPFDALGLPAAGALTDQDVRDAWRDVAAATHPDRDGGGDPAAYAAAAAAYAQLRTGWGRGEALADLAAHARPATWHREPEIRPGLLGAGWRAVALLPARVRCGRPGRLALRTVVAVAAAVIAVRGPRRPRRRPPGACCGGRAPSAATSRPRRDADRPGNWVRARAAAPPQAGGCGKSKTHLG